MRNNAAPLPYFSSFAVHLAFRLITPEAAWVAHVSTAVALGRRLYGCSKKFDDIRWNEQRAEQRRTFAIFEFVRRSSGIHVRAEKRASNFYALLRRTSASTGQSVRQRPRSHRTRRYAYSLPGRYFQPLRTVSVAVGIGKRRVNRAPPCGTSSTVIEPPCAATALRTISMPRPAPTPLSRLPCQKR